MTTKTFTELPSELSNSSGLSYYSIHQLFNIIIYKYYQYLVNWAYSPTSITYLLERQRSANHKQQIHSSFAFLLAYFVYDCTSRWVFIIKPTQ